MISFSGICQYFSEITLYMATIRFILSMMGQLQSPWPVTGIFCAAGLVSALFSRFKGFVIYLPLLLILPAFVMAESLADYVCLVPLAVLLFFHIYRRSWNSDAVVLRGSIKVGLAIFVFVLLAAAVGSKMTRLTAEAIPMFVLFMAVVILGMRVMRNEEMGRTGTAFYVLNALLVVLIAGVGFVFSNSWLLGAIKSGLATVYEYVLGPLLMGFAYVVIIIPMALGWLLQKIKFQDPQPLEETIQQFMIGDEQKSLYEDMEVAETSQLVPKILTALGIVFFLVIAFFIIRKLVDHSSVKRSSGGDFSRTSVAEEDAPKRRRRSLRNTPADAVRACYRKYLDICRDGSIPVDGSIASDEIAVRSSDYTGRDATDFLRRLWLPARYGEDASSEEDVKQAKQCLKEIKKNIREK